MRPPTASHRPLVVLAILAVCLSALPAAAAVPVQQVVAPAATGAPPAPARTDGPRAVSPVTLNPTISGLAMAPGWTAESNQADAHLGWSVRTAGDVNRDGYADVIVGAPGYDSGQQDEGAAFVYLGGPSGLGSPGTPANADWSAEGNQADLEFGFSVGTAGDVNGDGYDDVIVGSSNAAGVFVYLGGPNGLGAAPGWTAHVGQQDFAFHASAAAAGDVNGDGYDDVIVGMYGAPELDDMVLVYMGSANGLAANAAWEMYQPSSSFGASVGTAGDVNRDGYSDVIVGAPGYDHGETDEGAAFVYLGGKNGLSNGADWTAESNFWGAKFGASVGTAGDVNGDGYADVIVGSPDQYAAFDCLGRAYVYLGSARGLGATAAWTAESPEGEFDLFDFAASVGTTGDVNGDGYADVIVGRPDGKAAAYIYLGSASGLGALPGWTADSDQGFGNFGWSVGTAGDVNGDGAADVIVGAYGYDNPQADEGRAFVYYGNGPLHRVYLPVVRH